MAGRPFYIVDVFAQEKYAGNQLAVVRGAADLSGEAMQRIALEMNYSETTFILSDDRRDGGYDVRIFTTAEELPFAGHPTLGTAFVIQQEIVGKPLEQVVLNLPVGQIPVTWAAEMGEDGGLGQLLWMHQRPPQFGRTFEPETVAAILGIDGDAIDERFPIQMVSTGLPFPICPLISLAALRQASVTKERLMALGEPSTFKAILAFCPETRERNNDLSVRVFFTDAHGIGEDPATGSANGCLAGYLAYHRYWGAGEIQVRVEQGHEIGRPSLLFLRALDRDRQIDVHVGGQVVMVAKGVLV